MTPFPPVASEKTDLRKKEGEETTISRGTARTRSQRVETTMSPDDFKTWRKAIDFSKDEAAAALGVSKDTIEEYDAGNRFDDDEIPKAVALACTALYYRLDQWAG